MCPEIYDTSRLIMCRAPAVRRVAERYPIHVVRAWLGNSRAVAQEHCLQGTDAPFEQAVQKPEQEGAANAGTPGGANEKALAGESEKAA
jgi:hypothetical protein